MTNYQRAVLREATGRDYVRMKVRIRDNFTCQVCGDVRTPEETFHTGARLFDIHHLHGMCGKNSRGYDRLSDIDKLITVCHRCHFNHPEHSQNLKSVV